jgi:hypothetical protein
MIRKQPALEEVTDPADIARFRAQDGRHRRNVEWLAAHWADLLPNARGRFVVVAGEEAFVAETADAAWSQARAAHPEDDGAFGQFVPEGGGLRTHGSHRTVAGLR